MGENTIRAKAGDCTASGSRLVKRESYALMLEGQDIIAAAREQAVAILEEAGKDREALLQQAQEEGYRDGLAKWNDIVDQALHRAAEVAREREQELLRLAVAVARKIIGAELTLRPEAIANIVQEALRTMQRARHFTIQVNTVDVEPVRGRLAILRQTVGSNREIDVVESADVPAGGCIVESDLGIVDARLETQLHCLEEILTREAQAG